VRLKVPRHTRETIGRARRTSPSDFGEQLAEDDRVAWEVNGSALGQGPEGRLARSHDRLAGTSDVNPFSSLRVRGPAGYDLLQAARRGFGPVELARLVFSCLLRGAAYTWRGRKTPILPGEATECSIGCLYVANARHNLIGLARTIASAQILFV
jgi:hypothetical protein